MPLLASLRTGLAALCRKFIICIRLPDYAYYINGPETLPPPLSKEEEKVVFAGLEAGNPDCRDVLIVHNLRLVVYIAKKFESKTASVEDMISIGTIGLIKAVNTFVPSKNIKLATYASRCIENEILMYLRKSSNKRQESSIDEPLNTDCDGNELLLSDVLGTDGNQVGADLEQAAEKNMLLEAVGLPQATVTLALESVVEPVSLYEPVYSDGGDTIYVMDQVGETGCEENWISSIQFRDTVSKLSDREKKIMSLRYLAGKTQVEVAGEIGISQAQVSRLEKNALERIKKQL